MSAATKGKIRSLLQANKPAEARKLCESFCKKHKQDAEAWFLLGSIHAQLGETDKAIDRLQYSISVQDNIPVTHYNLGLIYLHTGKFSTARPCFEKALTLDPGLTSARLELANTLLSEDRATESIPHYEQALQAEPAAPAILTNLSAAYEATGQTDRAIDVLLRLVQLAPGNIDAHFKLGNLLHASARFGDAEQQFQAALKSKPASIEILVNLGNTQLELERFNDAITSYRAALDIQGESPDILFNLGNALRAAEQLDEAESTYRQLLEIQPDMSGALNNLGLVLFEKGQYQDAKVLYQQSLDLNPGQIDAYINLAKCYRDQRNPEQAVIALETAQTLFPDEPSIHWDLSLLLLETGDFSRGWDEYSWRWQGQGLPVRNFPLQTWAGEDATDKTILVYAEQGLGDEIMFASCFPALIKASKQTVVECEPRLAPLFQRSFPEAIIHAGKQTTDLSWLSEIPTPDLTVATGDLPRYFRRQLQDFPTHSGYLLVDPVNKERWSERYAGTGKTFTVGISWKGGHITQATRRSSTLRDWQDILSLPNVCFVNLQYGDVTADIEQANELPGVSVCNWDDMDPLTDMDNFAAQIAALDLVISVDNSTVHLAGALGINTWVLQSYVPDWRWMNHAANSYWYPSVRQFHQATPGEWTGVLQAVQEQLAQLVTAPRH